MRAVLIVVAAVVLLSAVATTSVSASSGAATSEFAVVPHPPLPGRNRAPRAPRAPRTPKPQKAVGESKRATKAADKGFTAAKKIYNTAKAAERNAKTPNGGLTKGGQLKVAAQGVKQIPKAISAKVNAARMSKNAHPEDKEKAHRAAKEAQSTIKSALKKPFRKAEKQMTKKQQQAAAEAKMASDEKTNKYSNELGARNDALGVPFHETKRRF